MFSKKVKNESCFWRSTKQKQTNKQKDSRDVVKKTKFCSYRMDMQVARNLDQHSSGNTRGLLTEADLGYFKI